MNNNNSDAEILLSSYIEVCKNMPHANNSRDHYFVLYMMNFLQFVNGDEEFEDQALIQIRDCYSRGFNSLAVGFTRNLVNFQMASLNYHQALLLSDYIIDGFHIDSHGPNKVRALIDKSKVLLYIADQQAIDKNLLRIDEELSFVDKNGPDYDELISEIIEERLKGEVFSNLDRVMSPDQYNKLRNELVANTSILQEYFQI